VADLAGHYALDLIDAVPLRSGFLLKTREGAYHLKRFRYHEDDLWFVHDALAHLRNGGFRQVPELLPTREDRPFTNREGHIFYLVAWRPGGELDTTNPLALRQACRVLASLHLAARGFSPAPDLSAARVQWGDWRDKFRRRLEELVHYSAVARELRRESRFARRFSRHAQRFIDCGRRALESLDTLRLPERAEVARRRGELAHRDYIPANLIYHEGSVWPVDFDNCACEIHLDDLAKFVLRAAGGELDRARFILQAYSQILPLDDEDIALIAAYLRFPHRLWSLARHRFDGGKSRKQALKALTRGLEAWLGFVDALGNIDAASLRRGTGAGTPCPSRESPAQGPPAPEPQTEAPRRQAPPPGAAPAPAAPPVTRPAEDTEPSARPIPGPVSRRPCHWCPAWSGRRLRLAGGAPISRRPQTPRPPTWTAGPIGKPEAALPTLRRRHGPLLDEYIDE